ncbi:thiamine-monophosphate kinase [Candidatus Saccharibacteria bacterium]|nr:thiamine-monophosphate kinase [Candidatus Saccharibacteria bacterium]
MPMSEQDAFKVLNGMFLDTPLDPLRISPNETVTLTHGPEAADDCAISEVRIGKDTLLMVQTIDFVRGKGFELYEKGYLTAYDLGWYVVGANLSDIAAMGALPHTVQMVVRYPKDADASEFKQIMKGANECAQKYGAHISGGDTGSYSTSVLAASATGFTSPDRLLTQSGAMPGQDVWLSGPTGLAAAARLATSLDGITPQTTTDYEELFKVWRRVDPQIGAGRAVTKVQSVAAGTDTSDGLKVALENIARKSGVNIAVEQEAIPIHPAVRRVAEALGHDALAIVCGNSVDFRLLFTAGEGNRAQISETFRKKGLAEPHRIGSVYEGEGAATFYDGRPLPGEIETHVA